MSSLTDVWEGAHLSDAALLQFLQGSLSPDALLETDTHLFSCEVCKTRLHQMLEESGSSSEAIVALTQAFSKEGIESPVARMTPSFGDVPDFDSIAGYVDGTLSPSEATAFETALTRFPGLTAQVDDLRALKQELLAPRASNLTDAPEAIRVPPMIVRAPRETETQAPTRKWWTRLVRPLQTFGATAFAALLLFVLVPLKQELVNEQQRQTQLRQQLAKQQTTATQLQQDLADEKIRHQKEVDDRKQRTTKIEGELKNSQDSQKELQATSEQQRRLIEQQQSQIERKNEQIERLNQTQSMPVTPTPQAPTPLPTRTSPPSQNGGDLKADQLLQTVLNSSSDLISLRSKATGVKGELKTFHLLSPVATKVRELQPLLRWEKVLGAKSYRIKLWDETDDQNIYNEEVTFKTDTPSTLSWRVAAPLTRGHSYWWEVTARAGHDIAKAPQSPDLAARFEVLSASEYESLQTNLKSAGSSLLQQAFTLASAGLKDEAQDAARLLKQQPKSP